MPIKCRLIGPNGETYNPTLREIDYVEEDCKALKVAMEVDGTDTDALIKIIAHRPLEHRVKLRKQYKKMFGQELTDQLGVNLTSDFKALVRMLLDDRATINANALHTAMKGTGTTETVIVEVLCTALDYEIEMIKEKYEKIAECTLEEDLDRELSGDFRRMCITLIQGRREELTESQYHKMCQHGVNSIIDSVKVGRDVDLLYNAGEGRLGTDEPTLIDIVTTRNVWHLKAIDLLYQKRYGKTLMEAIDSETSGDFRDALIMTLSACIAPVKTFSELLRKAMLGLGTSDFTLMRILVTRCEIDLGNISAQFALDQGQTLEHWVRDDTSGDYRRLLVALLGGQWRD